MNKPGTKCSGKVLIWSASGSVGGYAVQYAAGVISKLKNLGPYDFIMTASGDAIGASALSEVLQPGGGTFASVRPQSDEMHLAGNVHLVYDFFSMTTQKPENTAFTEWWYRDYLPGALGGNVTPTPLEKRPGGLNKIQEACADVLEGRASKKLVLDPQADVFE
ncbi:unnamed protein product [Aspergillus oryzae var. brunneus]|uniref:Unnamed protein product n=1 Tax=Aspergillus oryzae var. brunneus TaxID=332754 RepID=A0ABQ6LAP6_ASPOZ|nr:unnamed protein product [Aspergillus oryzae]GMG55109.1 unnamed protein product [Aspergillus oryzae var. brunneus]